MESPHKPVKERHLSKERQETNHKFRGFFFLFMRKY